MIKPELLVAPRQRLAFAADSFIVPAMMRTILVICLAVAISASAYGNDKAHDKMVLIPGGTLEMGSDSGPRVERPRHSVSVHSFRLDVSPVTVAQFAQFAQETSYLTSAEKFGDSAVLSLKTGRWQLLSGANWQWPLGPKGVGAKPEHPAVHLSWHDATAYCGHYGLRLPTEAEWEQAARGGTEDKTTIYGFGNKLVREGDFLANVWTGQFPLSNTLEDGYLYTSPVGVFGRTPLGLTDMAGNVWEWSADWFLPYGANHRSATRAREKVQKGGSFLCDSKICHGYRITARGHSTPDSSHMHVGFRCALSVNEIPL